MTGIKEKKVRNAGKEERERYNANLFFELSRFYPEVL
jgi:hypothetical protein